MRSFAATFALSSSRAVAPARAEPLQHLWTDAFGVRAAADLAVHAKKVADVRAWLTAATQPSSSSLPLHSSRVLILTGPPGTGKSATVRVLASELACSVHEWHAGAHVRKLTWARDDPEAAPDDAAVLAPFERWLTAHASLMPLAAADEDAVRRGKIALVDELPYLHGERERAQFRAMLERYGRGARFPLVVVLTESVALRTRDLVPADERLATTIAFNATPPTLMRKALLRVLGLAGVTLPAERVDTIVEQCQGDVRHAVNALQMLCVGEPRAPPPTAMGPPARPNKRKKAAAASGVASGVASASTTSGKSRGDEPFVLTIGRDETVSLFRALGKVLIGKRDDGSDKSTSRPMSVMFLDGNARQLTRNGDGRPPLLFDPEELVQLTNMDANTFALFLFENYVPYFDATASDEVRSIDSAANAADWLSLSAQVGAVWNADAHGDIADQYAGALAVRGIVHENWWPDAATAPPARSAFRPHHRPAWLNVRQMQQTAAVALQSAARTPSAAPLATPGAVPNAAELALDRAPFLHRIVGYLPPLAHHAAASSARAMLSSGPALRVATLHVPAEVRTLCRALCTYTGTTNRAAALQQDELACAAGNDDDEPGTAVVSNDNNNNSNEAPPPLAQSKDEAMRVFEHWAGVARAAAAGAGGDAPMTAEELQQQIQLLSLDPIVDE